MPIYFTVQHWIHFPFDRAKVGTVRIEPEGQYPKRTGGDVKWELPAELTRLLGAQHVEGEEHGIGEGGGLLLAGEVETVHLPGITPLVEGWCGLVVLEPLDD